MSETRTTLVNGKLALIKTCADCGVEGICTPDEDSAFRANHRLRDGRVWYAACCKPCSRLRDKKRREQDLDAWQQYQRMWVRLKKERAGCASLPISGTSGAPRLPAAPFVAWLREYARVTGIDNGADLGVDLGIEPRRVTGYLTGEAKSAQFDVVDRALMNARTVVTVNGRDVFTLEDLYPIEQAEAA